MPATAEQSALAADPGTGAQTLANLAYVAPELWPAIAAHPNAYPALIDWMLQYGPAEEATAIGAPAATSAPEEQPIGDAVDAPTEPGAIANDPAAAGFDRPAAGSGTSVPGIPADEVGVSGPSALAPRARPLLTRMSRRTRVISGAAAVAAIVAVALIVTLVVAPRQSASRAAGASAAAAQQAHDTAVSGFNSAVAACTAANAALSNAQNQATSTATTDPGTLKDPTLLDKLSAAAAAASGVTACVAPTMGSDTDTIQQQAGDTSTAVSTVQKAADSLGAAASAVTSSAQAKKDDAAAEAAAAAAATKQAEAAAAAAARTWHFTSNDGFSFDLSLQIGSSVTDDTFTYVPSGQDSCGVTVQCGTAKLADICSDFGPSTMVAIPITATFTATTKGFDTPVVGNFAVGATGDYGGPDRSATSQVEIATAYSGEGPHCTGSSSYGSLPSLGVNWTNPMKTGAKGTFRFDVILQKWRTPASPSGDSALLDYLTVVPSGGTAAGTTTSYSSDSRKVLTLNGAAVGG